MKGANPWDVAVNIVTGIGKLARRIWERRHPSKGEPETHGDEGGHPAVYPLDATRDEIRKRREEQP